nr:sulfatase [Candidatus Bathyarchaeota archaeon]
RVILITVDTLRADALSSYNNKAVPTPHMDALAQDGILFEKAYSAAPWTVPSVASLMTGLPPQVHMMTRAENKLPDNLPTLAEHMRSAGYHTGAIVSNPYLRPQIDIYRGFLEFANFPPPSIGQSIAAKFLKRLFPQRFRFEGPRTRELTDLAIDWIEEHSENDFFLWLHYFDPHTPYTPPRDFLPPKLPPVAKSTTFYRSNDIFVGRYVPSLEQRAWIRDLYDAEVRYVDKSVGRFLAALKRNNIYDDALIVLTSDHGEEFFEHGRHGHAYSLYNEVLSVPLLIKLPNWASHRRVAMPVSNSRIMPTLLQLCQLDYDQNSVLGSSLVPLRNSDGGRQALPIFSTAVGDYEDRISLILDDIKYIRFLISKNREELYDLTQDPTEQVNLAPFRSHTVTRARELLDKHNDTIKTLRKFHGVTRPGSEELDAETKKRLEAVGYVQ